MKTCISFLTQEVVAGGSHYLLSRQPHSARIQTFFSLYLALLFILHASRHSFHWTSHFCLFYTHTLTLTCLWPHGYLHPEGRQSSRRRQFRQRATSARGANHCSQNYLTKSTADCFIDSVLHAACCLYCNLSFHCKGECSYSMWPLSLTADTSYFS